MEAIAYTSRPEELVFDLYSPQLLTDPYPIYEKMHQTGHLHYVSSLGFWMLIGYNDVAWVLKDKRFGKNFPAGMVENYPGNANILQEPAIATLCEWMLVKNPPDHTRLRQLMVKAFSAPRIQAMQPRIEGIVHSLIDAVEHKKTMDVIQDFSFPLPSLVICDLLGLPKEDHPLFLEKSRIPARLFDMTPLTPEELNNANQETAALMNYFDDLCDKRRCEPEDDLITALVQAEENGDVFSQKELSANIFLLFFAGHETTVNLIANGLLAFYQNPEQLKLLKSDLSLAPNAVEECLRFAPSVQIAGPRTPVEEIMVVGRLFKPGERIVPLIAAANRDPSVYPNPNQMDITRSRIKPLTFGGGMHYCLGAELARIETATAFSVLFERLPNLQLLNIENPKWRKAFTLRGLEELRAVW